ncbi:MAG: hypothetical protein DHS20C01_12250 [marine bacterium B5-7]|nr:MAG: hypothetical protein DHS20C01_12250 [marine bacterium B5-7]
MTDTQVNMRRRRQANLKFHEEFVTDTYPLVREFGFDSIPAESEYFAVIIEPRPHPHFEYVLRNVMHFLGDGWGLFVVTSNANRENITSLLQGWNTVWVEFLKQDNLTREEFRALRKSVSYWSRLKGKTLLCFEVDTLLCHHGVHEFTGFDYIGAPWSVGQAVSDVVRVGNGGLSLRGRQAMIDMCQRGKTHVIPSEDSFFSIQLHLHKDEYRLPSVETAKRFSVETLYYPSPLGIHKPWLYLTRSELLTIYDTIDYKARTN